MATLTPHTPSITSADHPWSVKASSARLIPRSPTCRMYEGYATRGLDLVLQKGDILVRIGLMRCTERRSRFARKTSARGFVRPFKGYAWVLVGVLFQSEICGTRLKYWLWR